MSDEANPAAPERGPVAPRWAIRAMTRLHLLVHRLSGGRFLNAFGGDDVCFITMTGARSGRRLTIPLMYVPYGDAILLVASQGGTPTHPAWYFNLMKHPEIEVRHRGRVTTRRARLATLDEKPALWAVCDRHYRPYADYRTRTQREIPIFVCEPAA